MDDFLFKYVGEFGVTMSFAKDGSWLTYYVRKVGGHMAEATWHPVGRWRWNPELRCVELCSTNTSWWKADDGITATYLGVVSKAVVE